MGLHIEGNGLYPVLVFKAQQVPVKSERIRKFLISSSFYPYGLFGITRQFLPLIQYVQPLHRTEPCNGFFG